MNQFILPLSSPHAADPERVGPKAANLALLARANLPTPGGFCLTADAYHRQIETLGLREALTQYDEVDERTQRRLSVEIRLGLYEHPVAPDIAEVLLAVWRSHRETAPGLWAVRSSALIEDRAGANFAGQFESFLGLSDET